VPRVWPLISQVAFRSQAGGVVFNIAGVLEVHEPCLPRILPGPDAHFVSPFSAFRSADSHREPPEPSVPCWRTVATVYPLGNCDSPGPETCPDYLTRLGTVSNRPSPLSPFLRVDRRRANAARGTGESCLRHSALRLYSRGVEPTSPAQPFPSRLGLSSELASSFFRRIPVVPVLSMN